MRSLTVWFVWRARMHCQLAVVLVMWTNKTAEYPCTPLTSSPHDSEPYSGTVKDCVQLVRMVPLVWDTLGDGSRVLSTTVTADGSVDHYAFVVGPSPEYSITAEGGTHLFAFA